MLSTRTPWSICGALVLAACGGGGGGDDQPERFGVGCHLAAIHACLVDARTAGGAAASLEEQQRDCASMDGVWEACPSEEPVGTCLERDADGSGVTTVIYPGVACSAAESDATAICAGSVRCAQPAGGPPVSCEDSGDTYTFTAMGGTCGAHTAHLTLGCVGIEEDACLQLAGDLEDERVEAFTGRCALRGGTLVRETSGDACPSPGSRAGCRVVLPSPAQVEQTTFYYEGYVDLYDASLDCDRQGGSWVQALHP